MPTLLLSSQIETVAELTERCDGCGAAAKVTLTLTTGGELAFCGHHANRHVGAITRQAARIVMEDDFDWAGVPGA